jgi:hypothetical protein
MPLSIPAFDQYQSPMFPLRGLWNSVPPEGDKFCNAEIDWLVTTRSTAVQFSLSGNSPVSLSQIVALSVDNSRSGADVDFIFPDSGYVLTVPAHNQLVAPVFTNALMFYASAPAAVAGDLTILQILNSMPPPVPIAPSTVQNTAHAAGVSPANGTTPLVAAPGSGTLNALNVTGTGLGVGGANLNIQDGTGKVLWTMALSVTVAGTVLNFPVSGLNTRFTGGLFAVVSGSSFAAGALVFNIYYSIP